jgi:hypothetical protein
MYAFDTSKPGQLEYLVFEFGSALHAITGEGLGKSLLKSLFLPPSVRYICPCAFGFCSLVASVYFGHQSSLRQLTSDIFQRLDHIFAITIPSSVRRIPQGCI